MIRVDLPRFDRFEAWRAAARVLASAGVSAGDIRWASADEPPDLFGCEPVPTAGTRRIHATNEYMALAKTVSFHSDPERWDLLYAALLRMQDHRGILSNIADPLICRLNDLAKAVRRDIHKMHAFVRFHELTSHGPRRRFAAWFEPTHPILQAAAPFFVKRFFDMDWMIATPEGVARFDGKVTLSEPVAKPDLPADESHHLWQIYFANIFNPARIKTNAMRAEMPVKYWKNLPETQLVPQMLADAPRRVRAMAKAGATEAPAFASKVTARVRIAPSTEPPTTMAEAKAQAAGCTRCTLCAAATQTVWGEGPVDAPLMVVGEAPGDMEDLRGRPFIGPAGQLFHAAMAEAGLDSTKAWLTNAVKHFKFVPRGKRRLHQSPHSGEIQHCRFWLAFERRFVSPRLTVAMGASAAYALTLDRTALSARRGSIEAATDGGPVLITWHPSHLLRLSGPDSIKARQEFVADLALAASILNGNASPA